MAKKIISEKTVSDEKRIIKPPVLFRQTQQIIRKIERRENVKVLSYWNSVNGSICQNDVIALFEIIKDWGMQDVIYLFIKSDGGDGKASLRIVNLLRQHTQKLVAVVQGECASAATMLALGADEILMGPLAYLSAVDTSVTHDLSPVDKNNNLVSVSQDELARVLNLWNKENSEGNPYHDLYQYIHPLVFGAVDRAGSLSVKLCTDILSYHMEDTDKACEISRHLNSDYPSHGYPIMLREAQRIGLNAKEPDKELNDLFSELNSLYSQMGQRAYTDYDEDNYHNNEIVNILESSGTQIYYQNDKDWHYRSEERRYITMNDNSSWYKVTGAGTKIEPKALQIR
jgi:hypothetical protein